MTCLNSDVEDKNKQILLSVNTVGSKNEFEVSVVGLIFTFCLII